MATTMDEVGKIYSHSKVKINGQYELGSLQEGTPSFHNQKLCNLSSSDAAQIADNQIAYLLHVVKERPELNFEFVPDMQKVAQRGVTAGRFTLNAFSSLVGMRIRDEISKELFFYDSELESIVSTLVKLSKLYPEAVPSCIGMGAIGTVSVEGYLTSLRGGILERVRHMEKKSAKSEPVMQPGAGRKVVKPAPAAPERAQSPQIEGIPAAPIATNPVPADAVGRFAELLKARSSITLNSPFLYFLEKKLLSLSRHCGKTIHGVVRDFDARIEKLKAAGEDDGRINLYTEYVSAQLAAAKNYADSLEGILKNLHSELYSGISGSVRRITRRPSAIFTKITAFSILRIQSIMQFVSLGPIGIYLGITGLFDFALLGANILMGMIGSDVERQASRITHPIFTGRVPHKKNIVSAAEVFQGQTPDVVAKEISNSVVLSAEFRGGVQSWFKPFAVSGAAAPVFGISWYYGGVAALGCTAISTPAIQKFLAGPGLKIRRASVNFARKVQATLRH